MSLVAAPLAAAPRGCLGSLPVGTFRLRVAPAGGGQPLPVRLLNVLRAGQKLQYQPVSFPTAKDSARIAVVLAPAAPTGEVVFLEPRKAASATEWTLPTDAAVVGLIFGPQGLQVRKIQQLVVKNQDILPELADYAEQSSKVEGLVTALASSESGGGLDAALSGFSAQYGVAVPKLDTHASTDQQASVLLRALLPAINGYDPLSPRQAVMQQSAGLAASVAGMFFGSSVGLAAGGASMVRNLRSLMFPGMEFRSAFAQPSTEALSLCAKPEQGKARTRTAYLWAARLPGFALPSVALTGVAHVPLRAKSLLNLQSAAKGLERLREWRLGEHLVTVKPAGSALQLDLTAAGPPPGEYALTARWDWQEVKAGTVTVHPFGDLKSARISRESLDRLAEGNGCVPVTLTGADFQFVESIALEKAGDRQAKPVPLAFTLPKGKRGGEQRIAATEIDTNALARGDYRLLLSQSDGLTYETPFSALPPYPRLEGLPLRLNTGDAEQRIALRGSGLERIEGITTPAGAVELGGGEALVRLASGVARGQRFPMQLKVQGVERPLDLANTVEIAGPRPRIAEVRRSASQEAGVALQPDELPAGAAAGFALSVLNPEGKLALEAACENQRDLRQKLTLSPGDRGGTARLDMAGTGMLFLSLDPGVVGQPGCRLVITVSGEAGRSDTGSLGRVVRVPRIEKFTLSDEKAGEALYAGQLQGVTSIPSKRPVGTRGTAFPLRPSRPRYRANRKKKACGLCCPGPPPLPTPPCTFGCGETRRAAQAV